MSRTVGVAPGTTTIHLGEPGKQLVVANPWIGGQITLGAIDTRMHMRWDLVGIVGGASLIVALGAALVATAFSK